MAFGTLPWIAAIFYGLKPAVLAIVAAAVIRIGSRALKNEVMWTLAAAAFVAIFFVQVPFPLIIISAALIGFFGGKWKRAKFLEPTGTVAAPAGRHNWRLSDNLDDVHSLLSTDLFGRPLHLH